jgi:glutathione reductase (NADPH)
VSRFDYDLFVIGAGSGGVRAARVSAGFGARVAIAEERYLGGTCVNAGCIPKKLLVYASHYAEDLRDALAYGWTGVRADFDWPRLITVKDREIARLNGVYRRLLETAGVKIIEARAVLLDPHTVAVANRQVTAERILIATGGWPSVPEIPGRDLVITSNEAFHLERLPPRIAIVGGGYVAVEFAGIFNGLGVETELIYRGPLFLRGFDRDLRETLAGEMRKKGVGLRFDASVTAIGAGKDGFTVTFGDGDRLETDLVMFATGRAPNSGGFGLEAIGVRLNDKGAVVVDAGYRSSVPSVYAIGDVTDRMNLTPVAIAEGIALARRLFGGGEAGVDYAFVPTAVFSQPALGTVGLTEEEARERFGEVRIYKSTFTPLRHTLTGAPEKTFMKLVVDGASDRVVGVHMIGADAGEIIQGMAVALRAGATKHTFDTTIGIHPTAAEEFVTMREPAPRDLPARS